MPHMFRCNEPRLETEFSWGRETEPSLISAKLLITERDAVTSTNARLLTHVI